MSAETTTSEAENQASTPTLDREKRHEEAQSIVNRHSLGAAGVGLVPIPLLDMVSATALQIRMISEIGKLYGVEFERKDQLRNVVLALIGGVGAPTLVLSVLGSGLKAIPGIGAAMSITAVPATFGALTYAVGRVFVGHFEDGGTASNLDASKLKAGMKGYYDQALSRFKKAKPAEPAAAQPAEPAEAQAAPASA